MTKLSSAFSLGTAAFVAAGIISACGTDEAAMQGGPKVLDGGSGGSSSGTGGRGSTGGGGATGSPTLIGDTCLDAQDCGPGLICLTTTGDELGGGPAGGICTADCADDPAICADLSPGTGCFAVDDAGTVAYCMELCSPGVEEEKCHNRPNLACTQTNRPGVGYCSPMCRGDFECGRRTCDLASGLCVDTVQGTLPRGADCGGPLGGCRGGVCLSLLAGDGGVSGNFCSGHCVIGVQTDGCGFDPSSSDPPGAICLLPDADEIAVGDLGFCLQLCDCNADCTNGDFICDAFSAQSQGIVGRAGYCYPASAADGPVTGITRCPAGNPRDASTGTGGRGPDAAAPRDATAD